MVRAIKMAEWPRSGGGRFAYSVLQKVRLAMRDLQLFCGHRFTIEVNGNRGDSMP